MAIVPTAEQYIQSCDTYKARIAAIELVIDALETTALTAATNGDIQEYQLDDGQTKIRTAYRTAEDVIKSIKSLEALKNYYIAKCNGRVMRLRPVDRIKGTQYGG